MAIAFEPRTKPQSLPAPAAPTERLESIDLLRGAVMVLMVLDHVRDYFSAAPFSPTDLDRTTPGLFLTRWITHICAPTFVFLAGTGVFLAAARGKSKAELSRFLVTRGLWMIALDLTVVKLGITFSLDYHYTILGVLWAIGASMIALAGLIWLPLPAVAALGLLMMLGHNALDPIGPGLLGRLGWAWKLLHARGHLQPWPGFRVRVLYPLIPWLGVMATGYAFGAFMTLGLRRRRQLLFVIGVSLIGAFLTLRAANVYGDPRPWTYRHNGLYTAFSFLDLAKYPPSLDFLLMTLGPAVLALGFLDRGAGAVGRGLVTLGRVPMFYYLLQWYLAHALAVAVALVNGRPIGWLFRARPFDVPPGGGYGLPMVYAMWALAIALLYPASIWFADLKQRRKDLAWLRYF